MISKTMQPTLINKPSNSLPYDARFTKCGDSENSFRSKVMPFLIIAYRFTLQKHLHKLMKNGQTIMGNHLVIYDYL